MDLQGYLKILRKNWWLILICTLLGAGGAVALNETSARTYASTVSFYVSTPSDASGTNAYQANQYAMAKIPSYTKLLTSPVLADMVISKVGLTGLTARQVAGSITAGSDTNTVIMTASVVSRSPEESLKIATGLSTEFGVLVGQFDNRQTSTNSSSGATVTLRVVSPPTLNATPVTPKTNRNLMLGVGAGLLLGIILALARGMLDTSIRSIQALGEASGLPTIGALYYDSAAKKSPILVGPEVRSVRAEAFRKLRTNLQFVDVDRPVQVLVVTSSLPNEGKSTTAANLAILYADTGRRVLLIEADMRRGRIADYLGLERAVGLSDVLAGAADVKDVLQTWNEDGLTVLLGGSTPPNPSELLGSQQMATLLDRLRNSFDVIVIDTPPLLAVTDGAVAATLADGVLLVVRQGKTSRSQISASVRALESVDARVLGVVMSMVRRRSDDTKAYGYYAAGSRRALRAREAQLAAATPATVRPRSAGPEAATTAAPAAAPRSVRLQPTPEREPRHS